MGRVHAALEARLGPVDLNGNLGAICQAVEEQLDENTKRIDQIERTLNLIISVLGIESEVSTLRTLVEEFKKIEDPDQIPAALAIMADPVKGMSAKMRTP